MSLTTSVEPLEGNKVRLHVAIPAERVRAGHRRRLPQARAGGRSCRGSGRGRRPAGCSRPGWAPRSPASRRCATRSPSTTPTPSSPRTSTSSHRRRSTSPPARRRATSSSTPSSRCARRSTVEGHDALRVEIEKPEVGDEAIDQQVDSLRERFADLEDSATPLDRRRLRRDRHQGLHRRRVDRRPHRHRLPLRGRFGDRRAEARRGAPRQAPRRHPQVHRHPARALRRACRRRGRLPGAREGHQAEGPPRAHRRVGLRDQRVRHRRGAAERRAPAPRDVRAGPGPDGRAGQGASRPPPSSCTDDVPETLVNRRWSAASTTSSTASRSRGSG